MVDLDNNSTSHQLVEKAATLYSLDDYILDYKLVYARGHVPCWPDLE